MDKSERPKQPAVHPLEAVVVMVLVLILVFCVVRIKQKGESLFKIGNSTPIERVVED